VPTTCGPAAAPPTAGAEPRRHGAASLREVALLSGGIHASREPSSVRTLLGSCVAVCLHDPVSRVGGMNHFMLPDVAPVSLASAACGVHAMELLINELMKLGAQRQRLLARVFGAANVLRNGRLGVPEANARFALEFLVRERIQVIEKRVGGQQPMRVTFLTHTGEARVRAVGEERERAAQNDERHVLELRRDLAKPASSRVELF
jgi:chemotaxis receptor (MCP) glutamine deamidase CheD